ncbi:MAG: hypothetical protein HYX63_12210 [Gammaproteobacteria bacterium]|nr:hypothetical protein [Gammaproteobacteria bacterium]
MSLEDDDYRAAQAAGDHWREALDRTDKGALKPTLENAYLFTGVRMLNAQAMIID